MIKFNERNFAVKCAFDEWTFYVFWFAPVTVMIFALVMLFDFTVVKNDGNGKHKILLMEDMQATSYN